MHALPRLQIDRDLRLQRKPGLILESGLARELLL
jgi:hypothetical protein